MILVEEPAPHIPFGGTHLVQYTTERAFKKLVDKLNANALVIKAAPEVVEGRLRNYDSVSEPFTFIGPADEMVNLYRLAHLYMVISGGGLLEDHISNNLMRNVAENARRQVRPNFVPNGVLSAALMTMMDLTTAEDLDYAWRNPPTALVKLLEWKLAMPDVPLEEIAQTVR
jgi:hypothetical protein